MKRYVLLLILLLILPLIIRPLNEQPLPINGSSYDHNRYADQIRNEGIIVTDAVTGDSYSFNLYDYFLAFLPLEVRIYTPLLLGLISFFLFKILLTSSSLPTRRQTYALILILIAPSFLYAYTRLDAVGFATTFLLLAAVAYSRRARWLAHVAITITALTEPVVALGGIILFFVQRQHPKKMLYFIPTIIVTAASWFLHNRFTYAFTTFSFNDAFVILGAKRGFSLFIVVLGLLGLFMTWKRSRFYRVLTYTTLFLAGLYFEELRLSVVFFLSGYAAKTLEALRQREWHVPNLKSFTMILIVYTLLFSTALFMNNTLNDNPTAELVEVLQFPEGEGAILASTHYTPYIHYYTGMPSVQRSSITDDEAEALTLLWESQRLARSVTLLDSLDVSYVLLDEKQLSGDRSGLVFLLDNTNTFTREYSSDNWELWQVKE